MKLENQILIVGLATSYAASIASGFVGVVILRYFGYTDTIPVEIVGGESSQTIMMEEASYLVGPFVQIPVLLLCFGIVFWLYRKHETRTYEQR